MKHRTNLWVCVGGLLLWPGLPASAQTMPAQAVSPTAAVPQEELTLSLSDVIATVLANNPGLQAARRLREQAAAGVTTASAVDNPRLEYMQGQSEARVATATPGPVRGWGVSQFVENPAVRSARIEAARSSEQGVASQVGAVRNELVTQVQLRAFEYLLRRAEARALAEDLVLLEQVRERVRVRVDSGEAARYEIIKADAEIINARQRQRNASLQAEQSLLVLNRLAAGQLPARWQLSGELADEIAIPALEEIQRTTQANNPDIRSLQSQVDRAQNTLEGARSSRWPGVYLRYTETTAADIRQNMLGVQVQIPLIDQRRGPIAEATTERERAQIRLEGRQVELQQQVLFAWKSLEMARLRVSALAQGVMRDAEAALRVAQAAYRFGERGILDVLDAQRVLQSVRADLLDARYQLQAARIELEQLSGRYAVEQN